MKGAPRPVVSTRRPPPFDRLFRHKLAVIGAEWPNGARLLNITVDVFYQHMCDRKTPARAREVTQ